MRDRLAQRVLAAVMGWEQERLLKEQDVLQTLAAYKYDAYENFEPGVKFVESLAQWLDQFARQDREMAYRFVRERLVFVSGAEMTHLVRSMYPDFIRPVIRRAAADALACSEYEVRRVEGSREFADMLRRSLFLGLSDGARIDMFRRSSPDLDNEQVHAVYNPSPGKLVEMRDELVKALGETANGGLLAHSAEPNSPDGQPTFRFIFLLDDFAGTGTTMLRRAKEGGWKGRLKDVSDLLRAVEGERIFDPNVQVYACLYMVTQSALDHFERELAAFEATEAAWEHCEILCVQHLRESLAIRPHQDPELDGLLSRNYSPDLEDKKSYRVGQRGIKYGYGACGLPLVLHHNTPNNSLFVLWKDGVETWPFTPLFRRFERHRKLVETGDRGEQPSATVASHPLATPVTAGLALNEESAPLGDGSNSCRGGHAASE